MFIRNLDLDVPYSSSSGIGLGAQSPGNQAESLHPSQWQGRLSLEFQRRIIQIAPQTCLSRVQVQAPLKVQRPFYPEGEVCHCVMLHTAGGVVGGDRLAVTAQLQPAAQALLTTAAATKVYRSNGREAIQTTHLQVAEGARLEWLPQETILFDGAQYRQQLQVELAKGATWLGWDLTRLGRSARGERFTTGQWGSRIEVWQDGRLIWIDPQWIEGGGAMLTSLSGLAGAVVVGSLALVGPDISRQLVGQARRLVSAPQFSLTRLQTGLLCRYRGDSTAEARRGFVALWGLLRQTCWERSACIPRVWQ